MNSVKTAIVVRWHQQIAIGADDVVDVFDGVGVQLIIQEFVAFDSFIKSFFSIAWSAGVAKLVLEQRLVEVLDRWRLRLFYYDAIYTIWRSLNSFRCLILLIFTL